MNQEIGPTQPTQQKERLLIFDSINFAIKAHFNQTRKYGDVPYVYHCFDVTKRALSYQEKFKNTTCDEFGVAGNLHDTIEDTDTRIEDIENIFGKNVANIVMELTMPKSVKDFRSKFNYLGGFQNKSIEAIVMKIADRVCNVRDFVTEPSTSWYACSYALQAAPVFRAYMSRTEKANPRIVLDISEMEQIVRRRYSVSLFTSTMEEIEKELFSDPAQKVTK